MYVISALQWFFIINYTVPFQAVFTRSTTPPQLSATRPPYPPPASATVYSPSLLLHPKLTSTSSSAKVSDRIVKFSAIDPSGQKQQVLGLAGNTLLKALYNTGLIDPASHRLEEIEACSAECEVSIAQEWLENLPPRSYYEEYVLKRNSGARVLNKHSRLGCQVLLTKDLEGMVVAVPEPKPWDIP